MCAELATLFNEGHDRASAACQGLPRTTHHWAAGHDACMACSSATRHKAFSPQAKHCPHKALYSRGCTRPPAPDTHVTLTWWLLLPSWCCNYHPSRTNALRACVEQFEPINEAPSLLHNAFYGDTWFELIVGCDCNRNHMCSLNMLTPGWKGRLRALSKEGNDFDTICCATQASQSCAQ